MTLTYLVQGVLQLVVGIPVGIIAAHLLQAWLGDGDHG